MIHHSDTKAHILVVDDDQRFRHLIQRYLLQEYPCLVSTAANVEEAKQALDLFFFDALIVDIMMPGGAGTDLLSLNSLPPVLLLSAMSDPQHRIAGLEQGAHDYLTKPFEPKELLLRLSNILKRSEPTIKLGLLTYDLRKKVLKDERGDPILLTHSESNLLSYMAQYLHKTLSRADIAHALFPERVNLRLVDVQMNRLRKKIEKDPQNPLYLVSLRGQGYCLKTSS